MGVQGKDFKADLLGPNSKPSKGLRKANLSPRTKALLEEVALSEQVLPFAACPPPFFAHLHPSRPFFADLHPAHPFFAHLHPFLAHLHPSRPFFAHLYPSRPLFACLPPSLPSPLSLLASAFPSLFARPNSLAQKPGRY